MTDGWPSSTPPRLLPQLENFIFQSKAENSPLKLIDFGLSKREASKSGVSRMASVVGTAYYMAPEVVDRRSRFRVGKGPLA